MYKLIISSEQAETLVRHCLQEDYFLADEDDQKSLYKAISYYCTYAEWVEFKKAIKRHKKGKKGEQILEI